MGNLTSFYIEKLSVYNPTGEKVHVPSYDSNSRGELSVMSVEIPSNCWRFVPDSEIARQTISNLGLQLLGAEDNSLPNPNPNPPPVNNDKHNAVGLEDSYEELITITATMMSNGFFELTRVVPQYHWNEVTLVPRGGISQIYGVDYTCYTTNNRTRVIFNSTRANGPSEGMQTVLAAGDSVSVTYLSDQ